MLTLAFFAALRGSSKHLDQVVMQAIIELALERPCELRMIQVAGVKFEVIAVHRKRRILEVDGHFNTVVLVRCAEFEERMFIETKLLKNALQARRGLGHGQL